MKRSIVWCAAGLVLAFAGCGGGNVATTPAVPLASALELSADPIALTSDATVSTFVVQNDNAGTAYVATASPACVTPSGGIYVAGDGQALTAVAGVPTMFLAVAIGTPPASGCSVTVSDGFGRTVSVDATYETVTVQSVHRTPLELVKSVTPATATIARANDVIPVVVSGMSGTVTMSGGACAKAGGITVIPSTLSGGAGTFVIAPFGIGAINATCTVTVTDATGAKTTIPVSLAVPALKKLTASAGTLQFGCAGSDAPLHCRTLQTVTLNEDGASAFHIEPRSFPKNTCAARFEGPLKMVAGASDPALTATGPTATVAFDGLLLGRPIGCNIIPIGDDGNPQQTVAVHVVPSISSTVPPALAAAAAPPCVGSDSHVAVPAAPHGMYAWAPNARDTSLLKRFVIGHDNTMCGASLVIRWADIESSKGVYDFSSVDAAAAIYTDKKLTVNLLFQDASEGADVVTPPWVLAEVPNSSCNSTQPIPAYWNATFEADWTDVINHALAYFTNMSKIRTQIGYIRFATGGGAEALPPPGYNDGATCQAAWAALGYTKDVWLTHTINIVNAVAAANTAALATTATAVPHQLISSLPYVAGGKTIYEIPNAFAAVAAAKNIGFSFENLGAATTDPPAACNTGAMIINLHWCQAYTKYAGVVPLNMQPIRATMNAANKPPIDIATLLPYALDNNIQVFELYPDEWLEADGNSDWQPFVAASQTHFQAALTSAALVLGTAPAVDPYSAPF